MLAIFTALSTPIIVAYVVWTGLDLIADTIAIVKMLRKK